MVLTVDIGVLSVAVDLPLPMRIRGTVRDGQKPNDCDVKRRRPTKEQIAARMVVIREDGFIFRSPFNRELPTGAVTTNKSSSAARRNAVAALTDAAFSAGCVPCACVWSEMFSF